MLTVEASAHWERILMSSCGVPVHSLTFIVLSSCQGSVGTVVALNSASQYKRSTEVDRGNRLKILLSVASGTLKTIQIYTSFTGIRFPVAAASLRKPRNCSATPGLSRIESDFHRWDIVVNNRNISELW